MTYTRSMESISRNVGDLTTTERQVYETVLGHQLHAGQQIIVQLIDVDASYADPKAACQPSTSPQENGSQQNGDAKLPDWCDVYRGLSDKEIEEVEESILARSPTSRNIDVEF